MEPFLYYLLRASIVSVIFYLFYKVFVSRSTFHAINRAVLLLIVTASLALPMISVTLPEIELFKTKEIGNETINLSAFQNVTVIDELPIIAEPKAEIPWISILLTIYIVGVAIMLLRYLIGIIRVTKIIRTTRKENLPDGSSIYISCQNIEPFSWMHHIVIAEKDFTETNSDIIRHEKAHVKHRHSVDLLFVDSFCTLFWFNPFSWLLRKELRNVHEFQADAEVIKDCNDFRDYQLLLVRHCVGEQKFSIANNFELNNLQKRIKMIMKKKSSNKAKWLYTSMAFACLIAVITLSTASLKAEVTTETETNEKVMTDGTSVLSNNIFYLSDAKIVDKNDVVFNSDTTQKTDLVIENKDKSNKLVIVGHGDLKNPIYIVDGFEVIDISEIRAEKIAKIDVLKGKAATELYGEKGKNGVILITTKTPKNNITINEMVGGRVPGFFDGDSVSGIKFRKNTATDKLVIIDGKEGNLNDFEPDDIESFTVLQDNDATKIYGEKGKNGVILVTTKKNKKRSGLLPSFTPIDKSKEPLYILDGVPSNKKDFEALEEKEIESIKVLKGVEATALYGTRGLNGVILIATKKGVVKPKATSQGQFDNVTDKDKIYIDRKPATLRELKALDAKEIKEVLRSHDNRTNESTISIITTHDTYVPNDFERLGIKGFSTSNPPLIFVNDKEVKVKDLAKVKKTSTVLTVNGPTVLKHYGKKGKNGFVRIKTPGYRPKLTDKNTAFIIDGKLANKKAYDALDKSKIIQESVSDISACGGKDEIYNIKQKRVIEVKTR